MMFISLIVENLVLGAVTVALYYLHHDTAAAWTLAALIANILCTSYRSSRGGR